MLSDGALSHQSTTRNTYSHADLVISVSLFSCRYSGHWINDVDFQKVRWHRVRVCGPAETKPKQCEKGKNESHLGAKTHIDNRLHRSLFTHHPAFAF